MPDCRNLLLLALLIGAPAHAQTAAPGCPGLLSHPAVGRVTAEIVERQQSQGAQNAAGSAETVFENFRQALAVVLKSNDFFAVVSRGVHHSQAHDLIRETKSLPQSLTPTVASRCFKSFAPVYAAAVEADAKQREEREALERETAEDERAERQKRREAEDKKRQKQYDALATAERERLEREQRDQELESRMRQAEEGRREADRRRLAREEAEARKPPNVLRRAYANYQFVRACHEARLGYAEIFISDAELDRARRATASVELEMKKADTAIDANITWEEAAKLARSPILNRPYCQSSYSALLASASEATSSPSIPHKDF